MDWSTLRVVDLMEQMRMSAGTLSPTTMKKCYELVKVPKQAGLKDRTYSGHGL